MLFGAINLSWQQAAECPTFWALIAGTIGLWLLVPTRPSFGKSLGSILVAIAGGLFAYDLPRLGDATGQVIFWFLAFITLSAAVAMITSQGPVYSAIWFATSLLGTAGLFLLNGAQFLGVATVVVYAGAIVVTFLFVIMLAQPEGQSTYDRITWGGLAKILGVVCAAALVGILTFTLGRLKTEAGQFTAEAAAAADANLKKADGILAERHMANLGRHLFGEHLISVELAGTLLLAALVGAVAIALYGRPRLAQRIEEALR